LCNSIEINYEIATHLFTEKARDLRRFLFTYLKVYDRDYGRISTFIKDYAESCGKKERAVWIWWRIIKPMVKDLKHHKPLYLRIRLDELMR
jgi:hypothetical protein